MIAKSGLHLRADKIKDFAIQKIQEDIFCTLKTGNF